MPADPDLWFLLLERGGNSRCVIKFTGRIQWPHPWERTARWQKANAIPETSPQPGWTKFPWENFAETVDGPLAQAMLAAHKDLALEKRADIADLVPNAYGSLCNVAETRTDLSIARPSSSTAGTSCEVLVASIEHTLALVLQKFAPLKMTQVLRGSDPSRSKSRFKSRSHSRGRYHQSDDMCWYHWKFDKDARKCEKPCKFAGAENDSGSL